MCTNVADNDLRLSLIEQLDLNIYIIMNDNIGL